MFKSHRSVRTIKRDSTNPRNKSRRARKSFITFKDSLGNKVITLIGIGSLKRRSGNGFVASLWKQNDNRYAIRVWNKSETSLATYIGNASSTGAGDAIIELHNATSGSPYFRSIFHSETLQSVSSSLTFSKGTAFSKGKG